METKLKLHKITKNYILI